MILHILQYSATCSVKFSVLKALLKASSMFLLPLEQNPQFKNDEWSYIFLYMNDNLVYSSADDVL